MALTFSTFAAAGQWVPVGPRPNEHLSERKQIGPSALVGFSLFVLLGPLQTWFMKLSYDIRKRSMVCRPTMRLT